MRSNAIPLDIGGQTILVAALADIIKTTREPIALKTSRCSMSSNEPSKSKKPRKPTKREIALEAMRQASEQELTDMIRRQLALPMNKRTNFLRVRLPIGGSCL